MVKLAVNMNFIWNQLIQTLFRNISLKERDMKESRRNNGMKKKRAKEKKNAIENEKKKENVSVKENGKLIIVLYSTVNNQYNNLMRHLRRRLK